MLCRLRLPGTAEREGPRYAERVSLTSSCVHIALVIVICEPIQILVFGLINHFIEFNLDFIEAVRGILNIHMM